MILTFFSICFTVISLITLVVNLLFISHHGDLCGRYRYSPRSAQTENEIKRYGGIIFVLGIIALFFVGLAFLADQNTAKTVSIIFGGYKILIPPVFWYISYLTPGKKVWFFKPKQIVMKPAV